MNAVCRSIPVYFESQGVSHQDSRFIRMKFWLMHTGKNRNKSYFTKEVVEQALPTLYNTPILGFIEEDKYGNKDFTDHRSIVVKEDGQYKIKYIGQAFGIIPESCNPKWEMRIGDDGIEREYLTVEGLVWKKFSDAVDIIERDKVKNHSMELSDVFSGEYKNDGLFHFSRFEFDGACLLGTGVLPAMNSSTGEIYFTMSRFMEFVQEQMRELKEVLFSSMTNTKEEVGQMPEKLELLQKFSFTEEMIAEKGIDLEAISVEELEAKLKEFKDNSEVAIQDEEASMEDNVEFTADDEEDKTVIAEGEEEVQTEFSLSSSQMTEELRRVLRDFRKAYQDDVNITYQAFWYVDSLPESNKVICYDVDNDYYVGIDFSVNGDAVAINFDAVQRYKAEWVPMQNSEEAPVGTDFVTREHMEYMLARRENEVRSSFTADNEITVLRESVSNLEAELNELRSFKAKIIEQEREAVFTEFATRLSEEEIAQVRESSAEMSADDVRKELLAIFGAKAIAGNGNFTAQKPETTFAKSGVMGVSVTINADKPYSHILEKHLGKRL